MTNSGKMNKASFDAALLALTLDRDRAEPLHRQLAEAMRQLILSGRAAPGRRLPASRTLARELSVSRVTTLTAYDQLLAEGYLATRQGAGTFVAEDLPPRPPPASAVPGPRPSGGTPVRPFHAGMPDMEAFPHALWARHLEAAWKRPDPALLAQPDPLGWPPLREAIAAHLGAWRGLDCSGGQVVVTSGAAESFELLAGLIRPGGTVHVEAPCFGPMAARLEGAGLRCLPLPVDGEGLDTAKLGEADAAVVTPSRHYPLGMTLPLARRLALLDWAGQGERLVIEDDYDSEFRFGAAPLPALASLDPARVVYVGSFSKLLSPALRLGYMVLPVPLAERVAGLRGALGPQASLVPQPALARFMERGEFATHLRRMRRLYGQRRLVLLEALRHDLEGWLEPRDIASGMHLVCGLGPKLAGQGDRDIAEAAQEAGLELRPLSGYRHAPEGLRGLVLGYAAFDDAALREGVARLGGVLRRL